MVRRRWCCPGWRRTCCGWRPSWLSGGYGFGGWPRVTGFLFRWWVRWLASFPPAYKGGRFLPPPLPWRGDPRRAGGIAARGPVERRRGMRRLGGAPPAPVLGPASPEPVDPDHTFFELGFSSLAAVELRDRPRAAPGRHLAGTVAFDYPTPAALAG